MKVEAEIAEEEAYSREEPLITVPDPEPPSVVLSFFFIILFFFVFRSLLFSGLLTHIFMPYLTSTASLLLSRRNTTSRRDHVIAECGARPFQATTLVSRHAWPIVSARLRATFIRLLLLVQSRSRVAVV